MIVFKFQNTWVTFNCRPVQIKKEDPITPQPRSDEMRPYGTFKRIFRTENSNRIDCLNRIHYRNTKVLEYKISSIFHGKTTMPMVYRVF